MQIIKYLFLLLLLSFVAATVFIATQKGDFQLERSKVINSPKSAVFNYVNDYQNWPTFNTWMLEDSSLKMIYSGKTGVKNTPSCSWTGTDGKGDIVTVSSKPNESIVQKLNNNGTESEVFWYFKDTVGGTKVTWKTKGNLSFELKIYAALKGGVEKNLGAIYEKSLANLDKILDYEMNTYSSKVIGEVRKTGTFYLSQTFSSTVKNINKNSKIVFKTLEDYCAANAIEIYGKPFIIYHNYDNKRETVRVSFCLPVKNEIIVSDQSDIKLAKLEGFPAIKTISKGDYAHVQKALDQTNTYFSSKNIARDTKISHLEVYTLSTTESKKPSEWITTIYTPILPKIIATKTVARPQITVKKPAEIPIDEEIPGEF
ncbi:MAG: SRPBCC family protein [Flavobacterium sp.]